MAFRIRNRKVELIRSINPPRQFNNCLSDSGGKGSDNKEEIEKWS